MGVRVLHDVLLQVGNLSEKYLKRTKSVTCLSEFLAAFPIMSQNNFTPVLRLPPSNPSLTARYGQVLQNLAGNPQPTTMPPGNQYGYVMPLGGLGPPPTSAPLHNPNVAILPNGMMLIRRIPPASEASQRPKFGQGSFRMLPYHTVFNDDLTRNTLTIGALSTMNKVIFDYLITQGYPAAAARFAKEAGIPEPQAETALDRIEERKNIKLAILRGEIESAIHQINDYDARVCPATLFPFPYTKFSNRSDEANVHAPLLISP